MTPPSPSPQTLTQILSSYLKGVEEAGIVSLELAHPFPATPQAAPPKRPRQKTAQVPPVETPSAKPILPSPPKPEALSVPDTPKIVWCTLKRCADCLDQVDAAQSSVVLVTSAEETVGEHGNLLGQILHAAGYERISKPLPLTHPDDLKGAGARILAMGNPALQEVSPAGMELKIVRGMWQTTPYGKLISTFPPSKLSNNPAGKKEVWQDLKNLLKDLQVEVPHWTKQKMTGKK